MSSPTKDFLQLFDDPFDVDSDSESGASGEESNNYIMCNPQLKREKTSQLIVNTTPALLDDLLPFIEFQKEVGIISLQNTQADMKKLHHKLQTDGVTVLKKLHLHKHSACRSLGGICQIISSYATSLEEIILHSLNSSEKDNKFWDKILEALNNTKALKHFVISMREVTRIAGPTEVEHLIKLVQISSLSSVTIVTDVFHCSNYTTGMQNVEKLVELVQERNITLNIVEKSYGLSNCQERWPLIFVSKKSPVQTNTSINKETTLNAVELADYNNPGTRLEPTSFPPETASVPRTYLQVQDIWKYFNTKGKNVSIALLDSGVDATHSALRSRIKLLRSFVHKELACIDSHGHGTHCAGILVGAEQSNQPIGMAPEADLIVGKVVNQHGNGDINSLIDAINWAVEARADIISLSLGTRFLSKPLMQCINNAINAGKIIVTSASNYGARESYSIGYPARFGNVICVGSHTRNGQPSDFTSAGREVDFLAPGENIWSTWPNDQWCSLSGTSEAAPFVAGLAALFLPKLKEKNTDLINIALMRDLFRSMCSKSGHHDQQNGYGTLRPMDAFQPNILKRCLELNIAPDDDAGVNNTQPPHTNDNNTNAPEPSDKVLPHSNSMHS